MKIIFKILFILFLTTVYNYGATSLSSVQYNRSTRYVSPTNLNLVVNTIVSPSFNIITLISSTAYFTNSVFIGPLNFSTNLKIMDGTFDRLFIYGPSKPLTNITDVSLFSIISRTNSFVGGTIDYTIFCQDSSFDSQALSGIVTYSAVNKNGTWSTLTITENANNQSKSVTTGTIVPSWTIAAADSPNSTTNVTIKLNVNTSLTPATGSFYIYWQLRNNGTNILSL